MNFVKLAVVIFSVSLFLGFASVGVCSMSNSSEMSTLAELELSLEMSHKDYHLELSSDSPDKARLASLKLKIAFLSSRIDKMNSLVSVSRFGVLPEDFEMELNAALSSEDFERISELLHNLRLKGNEAVKLEAANLYNLSRQLRFIAHNNNGCCDELDTAMADLDGMINTIRV